MTKRKSDFTLPTNSLDELFSSQEERDDAKLERVKEIPLNELHPFRDHPFKIQNDEEMKRLIESIKKFGTLTPALARPLPEGGYELISGHRRLAACQVLGIETMPVIIREMSDDEAVIAMVDDGKIAFNPAVEISYLEQSEQRVLLNAMELNDCTPSQAQSIRLKKLSQEGELQDQTIYNILAEQKPNQQEQYRFKREDIRKYFPKSYTDKQVCDTVIKLLEQWQRRRERDRDSR